MKISPKRTGVALLVLGAAVALPAQAHHSFPATYFVDQSVTIEGTVVQFLFRNPHSFVHVLAPDKDGTMQRWAVEWGAGGALAQDNVSRDTLKPGDKVIIKGQPGRNPADHRIRMQAIEDKTANWKWSGTFG
jgi:DNA/RNA endonuclease YhcR with UshA esterase domain